jgi:hypothetical protein
MPVSADSLPYTVIILLLELAVGSLAFVTLFDARGHVTRGYVQMGAVLAVPSALLALLLALQTEARPDIDGYTLRPGAFDAFRVVLVLFTGVAGVQLFAAFAGRRRESLLLGAAGSLVGAVALALLAAVVADPAWSYLGVLLSMLAAAVAVGGSMMAMSWGHWYLTSGSLPKEPLEQMSLVVVAAVAVQGVLLVVAVAAPAREVPLTEAAFGVSLGQNPAFWLRVAVGLVFPGVLALLAWQAASIRGMMSATGLLYIAAGAVLAGEVLARGLLFATGAVV